MIRLNKVKEEKFLSLPALNTWVKEQPFDVVIINVQLKGDYYYLFYSKKTSE